MKKAQELQENNVNQHIVDALIDERNTMKQSSTAKQKITNLLEKHIDLHQKEAQQKQLSGLSYYIKKFAYAIPVAALCLIVTTLGIVYYTTPNEQNIVSTGTNQLNDTIDEEMNEVIQLAFSFQVDGDTLKKDEIAGSTTILLAHIRK